MAPPLELPVIQNWSCHSCGGCCRQHAIEISAEEHTRIVAQGWSENDGFAKDQQLFVPCGGTPWNKRYRLAHQPDGACVFLDEKGLCKIHAKFGEPAKPLACRVYPYAFHPAGPKVAVSLRFSCPSVVSNRGKPITQQKDDLRELERMVVPTGVEKFPAPAIAPGQQLDWTDTLKCRDHLEGLLFPEQDSIAIKVLRGLFLVNLMGQSNFEKIRGPRLSELLGMLCEAAIADVSSDWHTYAEPSKTGRMQFRLLAAQYARKDTFAEQQSGWRNRWKLFRAALRFTRGAGEVPPLQEVFKAVPFADLELPFGKWPNEVEEMLTRYFLVKVRGMHFCGAAYYDVPFVEGFQSLALMLPVTLWIARWLAASAGRKMLQTDDVAHALAIADHHHGYSPVFGQRGARGRVRLLAKLDDITRLVAWYSR